MVGGWPGVSASTGPQTATRNHCVSEWKDWAGGDHKTAHNHQDTLAACSSCIRPHSDSPPPPRHLGLGVKPSAQCHFPEHAFKRLIMSACLRASVAVRRWPLPPACSMASGASPTSYPTCITPQHTTAVRNMHLVLCNLLCVPHVAHRPDGMAAASMPGDEVWLGSHHGVVATTFRCQLCFVTDAIADKQTSKRAATLAAQR